MHRTRVALPLPCWPRLRIVSAQPGILTRELLIKYTPDWNGERFADGRPKVPDGILERMKIVTLEEAWAELARPPDSTISTRTDGSRSIPRRCWSAVR